MANKSIPRIEGILQFYTKALGTNYNAYRNHVYRVYHLTLLTAGHDLSLLEQESLAIAASFHDLGIWTHSTMDYLTPSIDLAKSYMEENGYDTMPSVELMINHHHQLTPYQGIEQELIEAFRKADLIDLSFGFLRNGLPKQFYTNLKEEFPFLGFHRFIFKNLIRYALGHLTRPFPMIKG